MIAAHQPHQRPPHAKLLVVGADGRISHRRRAELSDLLRPGDLVVANDAATIPASLSGVHSRTGQAIEIRLAGRASLDPGEVSLFSAILFGEGDYRMRTEDRPSPPEVVQGDCLRLGPLSAKVEATLNHPRLVMLRFDGTADEIWAGLARHGHPIQYSHVREPLALWDVWTPIAGPPVAFEPPSASFALDWKTLHELTRLGAGFTTITHAAGVSSTGDPMLDRLLPFDEPYQISGQAARKIANARSEGRRVIAVGTTVVRALEHSAGKHGEVRAGEDVANQRIGPGTRLRIVDAILSGTHESDTSHYQLLRAFTEEETLRRADQELDARSYGTHEFGDSVFVEKKQPLREESRA